MSEKDVEDQTAIGLTAMKEMTVIIKQESDLSLLRHFSSQRQLHPPHAKLHGWSSKDQHWTLWEHSYNNMPTSAE